MQHHNNPKKVPHNTQKTAQKTLKPATVAQHTGYQYDWIHIKGAQEHNLKNIDVSIPKNKLTVITGPSGSGKSSLALDILFTEGKRRYMDSLSSYARQFLGTSKRPQVDSIEGLCPAIAIEQKTVGSNPRSTVGTITEIYDYLRVLFARIGSIHCPTCKQAVTVQSAESITKYILSSFARLEAQIFAPIAHQRKGEFVSELTNLFHVGISRFMIDGTMHKIMSIEDITALKLQKNKPHNIDAFIDCIYITPDEQSRINEAVEKALQHGHGLCTIMVNGKKYPVSALRACTHCGFSIPELEPRLFSFNSPIGACERCGGVGTEYVRNKNWSFSDDDDDYRSLYVSANCTSCKGTRLNQCALATTIGNKNIHQLSELSIADLSNFITNVKLNDTQAEIGATIIQEVANRLRFLQNVGLGYLSLNRTAATLSGGEGQRIRLATQIGSALTGVLYILDEPSIGLHQRDNDRLIATLHALRDQGNTVIVVEHDIDTMKQSDYIIDMGPGAGVLGGRVMAAGTPQEIGENEQSLTGSYLSGKRVIALPTQIRKPISHMTLKNAKTNNLQDLTVSFPLGVLCGISGVSGSGKSTLIMQELVPKVQDLLRYYKKTPGLELKNRAHLETMVVIDQTPIGKTPRSNPATYLGIFNDIRKLFASLPESKARGYKEGRFSFNVFDGRCAECSGDGTITIEMHFLPNVVMECKSCKGKRYNAETLAIQYKGKSIADVLAMTAHEARTFFTAFTPIAKRLELLCDVGLDYLQLGQSSLTLSGGEAQRIKLVDELAKRGHNTLYILDEPTTGLHTHDIEKLLIVLNRLIDKGNSMIIIEHNIDVLKTVDHLIDLGPEGGDKGGFIVAQGTPAEVAVVKASHTGLYLRPFFCREK